MVVERPEGSGPSLGHCSILVAGLFFGRDPNLATTQATIPMSGGTVTTYSNTKQNRAIQILRKHLTLRVNPTASI